MQVSQLYQGAGYIAEQAAVELFLLEQAERDVVEPASGDCSFQSPKRKRIEEAYDSSPAPDAGNESDRESYSR